MFFWGFIGKNPKREQRVFALGIDYLLLFIAGMAITSFLPQFIDYQAYALLALAIPFLMMPIEAFLLTMWGTTPGKALFGITVRDDWGRKLALRAAWREAIFLPRASGVVLRVVPLSWTRRLVAGFVGMGCLLMSVFGGHVTKWSIGMGEEVSMQGWIQYASKDSDFSVQLPSDPRYKSHEIEVPHSSQPLYYHEFTSHQNKHVHYSVSHMKFPKKWKLAGSSTLLKGALDALITYSGGSLVERKFTTHQNYRALDFTLKQGAEEVRGRLILVGTTFYKLTMTCPASASAGVFEQAFIDSFDLLPSSSSP